MKDELKPAIEPAPGSAPDKGFASAHWDTIVLGLAILYCTMPGVGFVLYVLGLPWLVYAGILLVRLNDEPQAKRRRIDKLAIGAAAFAIALGLHAFYERAARADAEGVIRQVEAFRLANGRFPEREEIRIEHPAWLPFSPARHFVSSTPPYAQAVTYKDTWVVFRTHWYDLHSRQWRTHSM